MDSVSMNDSMPEIDLREYIHVLMQYWRWLVAVPLLAAIVTFAILRIIPDIYQASVLIAITNPQFDVLVDPRLDITTDVVGDPDAYAQLALSDELVTILYERFVDQLDEDVENGAQLREDFLAVDTSTSPDILKLSITAQSPTLAADMANTWAQIVIEHARPIYATSRPESVEFLRTQLEEREIQLENAEAAIVKFEAENSQLILENELRSLNQQQIVSLDTLNDILRLSNNVTAFRDYILAAPNDEQISVSDELTVISLQSQVFESYLNESSLSLNVDTSNSAKSRDMLVVDLDNLLKVLLDREDQLKNSLSGINPRILELQTGIRQLSNESQRLTTELEQIQNSRSLLLLSLDQEQIASQSVENQVRLVTRAIGVDESVSNNTLLNTLVALICALMLTGGGILFRHWIVDA